MAAAKAHADVQALLRFLTQGAKLPLSDALPKIGALRKQGLSDTTAIAEADHDILKSIFGDEKVTKQVLNAAKRATTNKKRGASETSVVGARKRRKSNEAPEELNSDDHLTLPVSNLSADKLTEIEIETNRAPLVLAFAVMVLKYTMPEQPLSSRLSLAQALVSANSQSKAKSIGLVAGNTASDEGWAEGQPKVKVLGRDIAILRRYKPPVAVEDTDKDQKDNVVATSYDTFWGLDLEALRKSNGPLVSGKLSGSARPPIHSPDAARAYLVKSMSIASNQDEKDLAGAKKKSTAAQMAAMRAEALSMVLKAIDLLCESWSNTLSPADLDSRAWSWYIRVRPDIAQGQAGWGQKGKLRLGDILKLRRESSA